MDGPELPGGSVQLQGVTGIQQAYVLVAAVFKLVVTVS